ncbi:SpaA isopeptide-forming pilin-related protein [Bifidobacterium samirii]|uniref:Peptidase n=1 Tax=Bifidobacterium samirii TaxID=2306974 RepID=A0A430FRD2_9BIFI|nr:isopeptide-forming domain-containing fimbrial protein [Bifidobacterium samirii]RSX55412.1 peptidase [Bifidobacterium samirii]
MKMRKLFAGLAAAATMLGGLALGATTANAAVGDVSITPADITIQLPEGKADLLTNRTGFRFVKLADYVLTEAEGAKSTLELKTTGNEKVAAAIKAAAKTANESKDVTGDPMIWVATNLLDSETSPYAGRLRDFVTSLKDLNKDEFNATVTASSAGEPATSASFTLAEPGLYLVFDNTGKVMFDKDGNVTENEADAVKSVGESIPMLVGTKITVKEGVAADDVQIPTTNINGVVNIKNDITIVKKNVSQAAASIGEEKSYTVEGEVPNWVGKNLDASYYKFRDVLGVGQTIDFTSIKVTVDGVDGEQAFTLAKPEGVTADTWRANGSNAFEVDLTEVMQTLAVNANTIGKKVTMTYTTTVNSDALKTRTVGNKVTVYNNGNPATDTTEFPTSEFKFTKVGGDGATALAGAEFQITKGDATLKFVTQADGSYALAEAGAEGASETIVSPTGGVVKVIGVGAGTYTVTETKSPEGYWDSGLPSFIVTIDDEGKVTMSKDVDLLGLVTVKDDKTTATVKNVTKITELPLTGGAGIAMFTVVAMLLAGVAGTVFMKSRSTKRALMA